MHSKNGRYRNNIKDTETHLKNMTEQYWNIEGIITNNEGNTKRLLQQRQFKKFYNFKHKLKWTTKKTPRPKKHEQDWKKSYASDLQGTKNANTNPR